MHKLSSRPLVYMQDIGGARFLLPVVQSLLDMFKKLETVFISHPISSALSKSLSENTNDTFSYKAIKNFSIKEWKSILIKENIGIVICTMSSKYIDMTNCNLIAACNELEIKSIGFFDHWKGFDRLWDNNKEFKYLTSKIGVIDDYVKDGLINEGVSSERIEIVGHPLLEKISAKDYENNPCEVIIVSQPNTLDKSFISIFNLPIFKNKSFVDRLASLFSYTFINLKLLYKSHPKEQKIILKNIGLFKKTWDDTNHTKKIFIGFDSMFLFECYLWKHEVIILNFAEFQKYSDQSIPYKFGHQASNFNELEKCLFAIVNGEYNNSPTNQFEKVISDSTVRSKNLIENALQTI
jgi:hypothetical protein